MKVSRRGFLRKVLSVGTVLPAAIVVGGTRAVIAASRPEKVREDWQTGDLVTAESFNELHQAVNYLLDIT